MSRLTLLALLLCSPALSQPTRTEVTKPTTPTDDARPNNPAVPDAVAITGRFERIVVVRLKFDADLLAGLERIVGEQKIRNAVILAGAGSLRGYHVHSVSNRVFPSKNIYTREEAAPADIVSMNGYVINGRIHAHMTLTNEERAFGGHLEAGSRVFTFAVVTLGVFADGMDLSRVDDKTYR
jgi:predicted DNA-binding protein with PD1-like motif